MADPGQSLRGQVCLASKPGRTDVIPWPSRPGFQRIDVTSDSDNIILLADEGGIGVPASALSPLLLKPTADWDGEQAIRFENHWQYLKVYSQLGHWDAVTRQPTGKWKDWRKTGYSMLYKQRGIRTPPEVATLKKHVRDGRVRDWRPDGFWWNGELLPCIEARKQIYIPRYYELIKELPIFKELQRRVSIGQSIMIMDVNGPSVSRHPNGVLIDEMVILRSLNDRERPFEHGYVIAAILAGVDLLRLC